MAEPKSPKDAKDRYTLTEGTESPVLHLEADEGAALRLIEAVVPPAKKHPGKAPEGSPPSGATKRPNPLIPGTHAAATPTENRSPRPANAAAGKNAPRPAVKVESVPAPLLHAPSPPVHAALPAHLAEWRGPNGATRVAEVRRSLAAAVDAWWRNEELPGDDLLRDGLFTLEAGHKLEEAQRTLLARTALARRHGTRTALRHLADPERAASLLHEALLRGDLGPEELRGLLADSQSGRWAPLLAREIRADLASPTRSVADRAEAFLQILAAALPAAPARAPGDVATVTVDDLPRRHGHVRLLLSMLIVLGLLAVALFSTFAVRPRAVVRIPAGIYAVATDTGERVAVTLAAFDIDRTEVTNEAWALCVSRGRCLPPRETGSATRERYHDAGLFAEYPVIYVTLAQADAYCRAQGKRLPTAAEWEVAATFAPATEALWTYPWGELFTEEFVVSALTHEDTAVVRSRSTRGDSPLGAADMSGNVAEWTATQAGAPPAASALAPQGRAAGALPAGDFVVKGGSFLSGAEELLPARSPAAAAGAAAPWLGLRCASNPTP